ncbi:GDF9 factor, partial [Daphoenositta chrysoptera]|nr:GDF9 factor [Daphoenositta chrysoptera]
MESTWRICVCLYCCLPWLSAGTQNSPRSRGREGSEKPPGFLAAPEDAASELRAVLQLPQGGEPAPTLLPPLLKVLHARGPRAWHSEAPRLQPDSGALRYMRRLYRMSATREGVPKAQRGRLYNTVRLFTPGWECEHRHSGPGQGDVHSVDLIFNLDHVTALE